MIFVINWRDRGLILGRKMKEIKTANYKKKFGRGEETYMAEGQINTFDHGSENVEVTFIHTPAMSSMNHLEPSSGSEWEIIKVVSDRGETFSDAEIEIYQEQIDKIIQDWEINTDLRNGPDPDWGMDAQREMDMF